MSAQRLVSRNDEPDLSAFTPEQQAQLLAFEAARSTRTEGIFEAVYRAAIGVARAIKPGKRWEGL